MTVIAIIIFNFTIIAAILTDLCQNISPTIYIITPILAFKSLFCSMLLLLTENSPFVLDARLDVGAPQGEVMKSTSGPIWFWQWPVVPFHEMGMDHVCSLPGKSIRSVPFLQRRFRCLWNEVVMHRVCLLFAIMALHLWPTSRTSIFSPVW